MRKICGLAVCGVIIAMGLTFTTGSVRAHAAEVNVAQIREPRATTSYTPGPYRIVGGIRYGSRDDQRLDLLYPPDRAPEGVVVWAHGGAWVSGDRKQARTQVLTRWLIDQGWVIASFDYRLAKLKVGDEQESGFPMAIADAQLATRWVQKNMRARNLGSKVLVGGWSAGGNIATMSSVIRPEVTGVRGEPLHVDGVLSVGGITEMWEMYKLAYSFYSVIAARYVNCFRIDDRAGETSRGSCDNAALRSRFAKASVAHHLRRALQNEQFVPPLYLIAGEKDPLVRPDTQAVATARLWTQLTGSPKLAVADVMVNGAHDPMFGEFDDRQLSKWLRSIRDETIVPYRELHFRCHFLSRRSCVSMYGLARR